MSAVNIQKLILPENCWRNELLSAQGVVVHWISVPPDHPAIVPGAVEDPYDPFIIYQFLKELNLPGSERGRVLQASDEDRAWGSYHLLIPRYPHQDILHTVPFDRQAYHAGKSQWPARGLTNLNSYCEGWVLIGGEGVPFTDYQYEVLAELAGRGGWRGKDFVGHDFVTRYPGTKKSRKPDPGPLFDWKRLREEIGR